MPDVPPLRSTQETTEEDQFSLQSWRRIPPYLPQTAAADGFASKWHGSCYCGAVQFSLSRDAPLSTKYCHCFACQKQHGAPFQMAAIFHKEDMTFENGAEGLEWFDPSTNNSERNLPSKVRCAACKSPIMDEGRNVVLLFPSLVRFSPGEEGRREKEKWKAKCHIFYEQRIMDVQDGLPKWSGMNKTSSLMDEK